MLKIRRVMVETSLTVVKYCKNPLTAIVSEIAGMARLPLTHQIIK